MQSKVLKILQRGKHVWLTIIDFKLILSYEYVKFLRSLQPHRTLQASKKAWI